LFFIDQSPGVRMSSGRKSSPSPAEALRLRHADRQQALRAAPLQKTFQTTAAEFLSAERQSIAATRGTYPPDFCIVLPQKRPHFPEELRFISYRPHEPTSSKKRPYSDRPEYGRPELS
jgi:hypothetical protein